ncbi:MAG: sensor histidine kinase [Streptosporangiaceae bacterium]
MKPDAIWGRVLRIQAVLAAVVSTASIIAWAAAGGSFWPRWVLFGCGTALAAQLALRAGLRAPTPREQWLAVHWRLSAVLAPLEIVVWLLIDTPQPFWPTWAILAIAIALGAHILVQRALPPSREKELAERVDVLTRSRRGVVDVQSAELQRIERDLHDGAQARIVSLAMNLGLAEQLAQRDPDAATELIAEARQSALAALDELRTVMSGIQPPVLSDRGLAGAVQALTLDLSVPATVTGYLPGRPALPVESAAYLAVAECLANVVKHSRARRAWVTLGYGHGLLSATVGDDGVGGADISRGTGLAGVARRLEVLDGTITVRSPAGGPTKVTLEIPCELSSQKTTSSSETD